MSTKREILLIGVLCLFATIPAFADSDWLVAETDKGKYETGENMEISGFVFDAQMPQIAIKIYDPDGEILGAYNVEVESDDMFSKTISLDSPFYDKSGIYSVKFEYGQETDELSFEIDGIAQSQPAPSPAPTLAPAVLMVMTDKDSYSDNEFITISGLVSDVGDPTILIGIFDPDGTPTGFYMPQVGSDLEFSASFLAKSGVNFKKQGTYMVKANYGQSKQVTSFSFVDAPQPSPSAPSTPPPSQIVLNPKPTEQNPDSPEAPKPVPAPKPKPVQTPVQSVPVQTTQIIQNTSPPIPQQTQEQYIEPENALSEKDKKIGEMLNEMTLRCDNSKYTDSIIYGTGMGPALMRLCNYDQAVEYFDKALTTDPENVDLLTNKGSALAKLGRFSESITNYDSALEIDPDYTPALLNKANALAEIGKLDSAIVIYNKILDDDPENESVQKNLQKAREEVIKNAKKQNEKQVQVVADVPAPVPKMEEPKTAEPQKPANVITQIGSFFAGIFGFLK